MQFVVVQLGVGGGATWCWRCCNLVMVVVQCVGVNNTSFGVFYSVLVNLVFMTHFLVIDDSCDSCHMTHRS